MGCASSTASGANKTHVDLSEKDLTELPSIPVATTVLNCSSNKLAALPSTIGDLKALEELDASANQLTSLPAEIDQCEKLEKLMLFANKIKELPPKFPPALTELNLFNNAVKKLPPCIGELTALQEVNVAANKLMMTSDAMFASWGCVTVLNMYDNNLVRFGSIAPMSSLVELRLSGNNLEAMPTLGQHAALKIMEIHKNRISTIPDEYFESTPALERLSLWSNMLETLPPSLCKCSQLVGLQIQENKLTTLPCGNPWPANLETLFVQSNPLSTLPAELADCKALRRVNVSQTSLGDDALAIAKGIEAICISADGGIYWSPSGEKLLGQKASEAQKVSS